MDIIIIEKNNVLYPGSTQPAEETRIIYTGKTPFALTSQLDHVKLQYVGCTGAEALHGDVSVKSMTGNTLMRVGSGTTDITQLQKIDFGEKGIPLFQLGVSIKNNIIRFHFRDSVTGEPRKVILVSYDYGAQGLHVEGLNQKGEKDTTVVNKGGDGYMELCASYNLNSIAMLHDEYVNGTDGERAAIDYRISHTAQDTEYFKSFPEYSTETPIFPVSAIYETDDCDGKIMHSVNVITSIHGRFIADV